MPVISVKSRSVPVAPPRFHLRPPAHRLPVRVADALGPAPRDALAALVEYGLSDAEIARFRRLPQATVSHLRGFWGIRRGE